MIRSSIKKITAYLMAGVMLFSGASGLLQVKAADIPKVTADATAANILAIENAYDPEGAYILKKNNDQGNDFTFWWKNCTNLIKDMNTGVHESFHNVSHASGKANTDLYYFGTGKEDIYVTWTDVFTSDAIYASIPDSLKTISHAKRGKKYLGEDSEPNMSSIKCGAYGILQEYAAYVRGARTDVNLINYVETQASDWNIFEDYVSELANDVEAEAEFTYFLLHYLSYAKTNNLDVYNGIMSNENFKKAVKQVADMSHYNVNAIGTDIFPRLKKFFEKGGYKAYYNDEYFGVMFPKLIKNADGTNTSGGSIGLYYDSYYAYMAECNKEPYASIAKELGMNITYSHITPTEDVHTIYRYDDDGNIITREEYDKQIKEKTEKSGVFKLDAPKISSVANVSKGIKITWKTLKNAERFEIHRFNELCKGEKIVGTVKNGKATSFIDTSAKQGKSYTYQIFAYGTPPFKGAKEVHSSGANSKLIMRLKAPTVKKLKAGKKCFTVNYGKVTGASGYDIQYSLKKNFKNKKTVTVDDIATVKATVKKLTGNKVYYVKVRAYNDTYMNLKFYSAWSSVKKIKVKK